MTHHSEYGEPSMNRFLKMSMFVFLLCCYSIHAQSVFSSKGAGSPRFFPNARAMGMGGISYALPSLFSISMSNPATLYTISVTRLSIHYGYDNYRIREGTESAASEYSNFGGFQFAVPLGSGMGVAAGLSPLTRMDYNFVFKENLSGESYEKSVEGQGGLNTLMLSFCWAIRQNLSLGISGHLLFGRLREEWNVVYDRTDFVSSKDIYATTNWGFGFTAGLSFRPLRFLTLGAVFTPTAHLTNRTDSYHTYNVEKQSRDGSLSYPASWGLGTTFHIGEIGLIGVEYAQQDWSTLTINDQHVSGTQKTQRISAGLEIQATKEPFTPYLKRIAYRLGCSYQPYFSKDPDGNGINEYWITAGLGLPLFMNASQIDIAFGLGKRGSLETNGISENLFRITVTVSGGEKWFTRRY